MKTDTMTAMPCEYFVLPNRKYARLYFPKTGMLKRWRYSAFYPAFRWNAKVFRTALRIRAFCGWGDVVNGNIVFNGLHDFLHDCFPAFKAEVALVGTPGPRRKITVQLWDECRVIGYLKYADTAPALLQLNNEYAMLTSLPEGIAPKLIKYDFFGKGKALVTTALPGRSLPARLPPPATLIRFLDNFHQSTNYPIEQHPWVIRMRDQHNKVADRWLEPLSNRSWPTVFQHGDCAPWNMICKDNGVLCAIDWEYGMTSGFPHLDHVFYLLQVAALIYRWKPEKAYAYALKQLSKTLSTVQADAVIKLTMFESYHKMLDSYHYSETPLQNWRKAIWKQQA